MKQKQQKTSALPWVSRLLSLLFSKHELHVPSKNMQHYRNKITYSLPLSDACGISPLADERLNSICQAINDWMICSGDYDGIFQEVMAKCVRDGSVMIRLTVKRYDANKSSCSDKDEEWNTVQQASFVSQILHRFPQISCICYNETHDQSRPTKDSPLHLIHGENMFLLEQTPSGLSYRISPDSFCEVNHEVEDLQYAQTVEWIKRGTGYQNAILICSGRDINSYGLGFGSLRNGDNGDKVFSEVIVVQHCPLVMKDAIANFKRHKEGITATVLHLSKDEMAHGVKLALDAALERQNHPPVCVVTTGGRKGLDPTYLKFLKDHESVRCVIYNSCSTKSLEVDIEGFTSDAEGYYIDDFRSYDFFPGTKYTASVTRLLRRPRTLILPVGPAGTGKSTISKTLSVQTNNSILWWHRDLEFAKLRNENISMRKAKSMLHSALLSFLKGECKSVRFVDSTNGNAGARVLYTEVMEPDLLVVVELSPSTSQNGDGDDCIDVVNLLLDRTRDRLEGGNAAHPSFPTTTEEQRQKHEAILKGIEYPDANLAGQGCFRTIHLRCNPFEEQKLSALPFEIYLAYSTSAHLQQLLHS